MPAAVGEYTIRPAAAGDGTAGYDQGLCPAQREKES